MLVACVGNLLRGDDGFGLAVADCLQGRLPAGVDLIETGTAGLGIVHQLMDGYGGLIVVDLVDRHVAPGTVLLLVPDVPEVTEPTLEDWRAQIADLHLAEPSRLLLLARASGVLPERVLVVGCQPRTFEDFEEGLSPQIAAAVPVAARRVHELVDELLLELR
ncbi:MAG: hydrogenase maturation protease [Actinomycetota bacterium]|nr:hydrogenase maturation protease [Actinomycetota bacterium]